MGDEKSTENRMRIYTYGAMECDGMRWNAMESDGIRWKAMECDGM